MNRKLFLLSILVFILAFTSLVNAQESFYRVYQYETPLKGHVELTRWATYIFNSDLPYSHFEKNLTRDHLAAYSIEAEYGLTDHLSIAGYADFHDAKGDYIHYIESRIEARYRLNQRYDNFVNTAFYLEYYIPRMAYSSSHELEARIILDKDLNDFRLVLNPSVSKYVTGDETRNLQPGLSSGLYYRRGKVFQPGVEFYENFYEKTSVLIPTVDINITGTLTWNLGVGFGLNQNSDKLLVKSILVLDVMAIRPSVLMRKKIKHHDS